MERFCCASDWPARYTPGEQAAFLEKTLPLTSAEWRTVLAHRASYLRAPHGRLATTHGPGR